MKFSFYMPTKVIMGKECISENLEIFNTSGRKAVIVTGKQSAKKNGAFADIHNVLEKLNIEYKLIDTIEANPAFDAVKSAANSIKEFNADFIIGIGGGSPLDAAKAIAILCKNDLNEEQLFSIEFEDVLPIIAVPTTAGTGSEVTPYSIITDKKINKKRSIATEKIYPQYAFLDARYMTNLPYTITVNTAMDALSHAVEGYLSGRSTTYTDFIAEESIRLLGEALKILHPGKISFEARETLLYASMLAGQVIAQTGTTALHAMGYYLTVYKNIDHGRANALLFSEYLSFVSQKQAKKVDKIIKLMNLKGLNEFKNLVNNLLTPKEDLTEEDILKYAEFAVNEKNIKNTVPEPDVKVLEYIYKKSLL